MYFSIVIRFLIEHNFPYDELALGTWTKVSEIIFALLKKIFYKVAAGYALPTL
jgi:hypothetical protein